MIDPNSFRLPADLHRHGITLSYPHLSRPALEKFIQDILREALQPRLMQTTTTDEARFIYMKRMQDTIRELVLLEAQDLNTPNPHESL